MVLSTRMKTELLLKTSVLNSRLEYKLVPFPILDQNGQNQYPISNIQTLIVLVWGMELDGSSPDFETTPSLGK